MRLLLLIVITTLYLAFPPPAQSALAWRYESPAPKSNIINTRVGDEECECEDDEEDDCERDEDCDWSYKGDTAAPRPEPHARLSMSGEVFAFMNRQSGSCTGPESRGLSHFHSRMEGPKYWKENYPCCGGQHQSPIDLYDGTPMTATPFQFHNYDDTPTSVTVINNGDTARVTVDMPNTPYVSGGNLDGEYEFVQLHFHWGSNNSVGSEHLIQHKRYPCEVHLVHYKKSYKDQATATKYEDGLAVLGVMFTISEEDNPALAGLITALASVTKPCGQKATVSSLLLSTFLPNNRNNFYRYQGSLTTPPCNEAVVWTVFSDTLNISAAQMAAFRKLKDAHGHPLVDNFRPLQPLGTRPLYFANSA